MAESAISSTRGTEADENILPSSQDREPTTSKIASQMASRSSRQALVVSGGTVIISALNYMYSLVLIRLLPPREYSAFASAQGLLLILATGCMAAIPWAVARHVVLDRSRHGARQAMSFGAIASLLQGVSVGLLTFLVMDTIAGPTFGASAGIAALLLSLVAAPIGFLQGEQRLVAVSLLRLVEACIRVGCGVIAALTIGTAASAVAAFSAGSLFTIGTGLVLSRRGLPFTRGSTSVFRNLTTSSMRMGLIQISVALLCALDTIVVQFADIPNAQVSDYQVAAILGRVPFFLSGAVALTYYQPLVRSADSSDARLLSRRAVKLYISLGLPAALIIATLPPPLLHLLLPRTSGVTSLLPFTVISGLLIGFLNVVSTEYQARGQYASVSRLLLAAVIAQPIVMVVAGRIGGVIAYGIALDAVALSATVGMLALSYRAGSFFSFERPQLFVLAIGAGLSVGSIRFEWLWPCGLAILGLTSLRSLIDLGTSHTDELG